MIRMEQLRAFRDELVKIAFARHSSEMAKLGNLPKTQDPPGTTVGKVSSPKKGGSLSKTLPTYTQINSAPEQSPMAGMQSFSAAPAARS